MSVLNLYATMMTRLSEWKDLRYRYKGAGCPWPDVPGLRVKAGTKQDVTNCSWFQVASVFKALEDMGRPVEWTRQMQDRAMLVNLEHRDGFVGVCVELGIATEISVNAIPKHRLLVAQGWSRPGKASGGHAFFFQLLATGRVITIEANGSTKGTGALVRGLDGVGSRVSSGSGMVRDGWVTGNDERLPTLDELLKSYPELYLAELH